MSPYDKENIVKIVDGHGDWFTAQLLRLIAKADRVNRERIRAGFPEEVCEFEKAERAAWSFVPTGGATLDPSDGAECRE